MMLKIKNVRPQSVEYARYYNHNTRHNPDFRNYQNERCRAYNKKNYDKNHNYQLNKNNLIKFLNSDMKALEVVEGYVLIKFE
jgi:hypothetical protein